MSGSEPTKNCQILEQKLYLRRIKIQFVGTMLDITDFIMSGIQAEMLMSSGKMK